MMEIEKDAAEAVQSASIDLCKSPVLHPTAVDNDERIATPVGAIDLTLMDQCNDDDRFFRIFSQVSQEAHWKNIKMK